MKLFQECRSRCPEQKRPDTRIGVEHHTEGVRSDCTVVQATTTIRGSDGYTSEQSGGDIHIPLPSPSGLRGGCADAHMGPARHHVDLPAHSTHKEGTEQDTTADQPENHPRGAGTGVQGVVSRPMQV